MAGLVCSGCEEREIVTAVDNKPAVPAYGDTIIMGTGGDASNLLPVLSSDSASSSLNSLVYNGLVRYDKDLHLEGDLAESWGGFSPDNLKIVFHLRKGRILARWHAFHLPPMSFSPINSTLIPRFPRPTPERYRQVKNAETPDPLHLCCQLCPAPGNRLGKLVRRHPSETPPGEYRCDPKPPLQGSDRYGAFCFQGMGRG